MDLKLRLTHSAATCWCHASKEKQKMIYYEPHHNPEARHPDGAGSPDATQVGRLITADECRLIEEARMIADQLQSALRPTRDPLSHPTQVSMKRQLIQLAGKLNQIMPRRVLREK